ncbi:hypothetical protein MP213Fo_03920 [Pseudochrobactrum sp. MP213Fo]
MRLVVRFESFCKTVDSICEALSCGMQFCKQAAFMHYCDYGGNAGFFPPYSRRILVSFNNKKADPKTRFSEARKR